MYGKKYLFADSQCKASKLFPSFGARNPERKKMRQYIINRS